MVVHVTEDFISMDPRVCLHIYI